QGAPEQAELDLVGRASVLRVELEPGALEVLHRVHLAVGEGLLQLAADRVAEHLDAAVLLPEAQEGARDAVAGLREEAGAGLAREGRRAREGLPGGVLGAEAAALHLEGR